MVIEFVEEYAALSETTGRGKQLRVQHNREFDDHLVQHGCRRDWQRRNSLLMTLHVLEIDHTIRNGLKFAERAALRPNPNEILHRSPSHLAELRRDEPGAPQSRKEGAVLGWDASGIVTGVEHGADSFEVGDRVAFRAPSERGPSNVWCVRSTASSFPNLSILCSRRHFIRQQQRLWGR